MEKLLTLGCVAKLGCSELWNQFTSPNETLPKTGWWKIPSGKLTKQWNIPIFNRNYIFTGSIFHCYVSLPECKTGLYPRQIFVFSKVHPPHVDTWHFAGRHYDVAPRYVSKSASVKPRCVELGLFPNQTTVDGLEIQKKNHLDVQNYKKKPEKNGINYQPQLVSKISAINSNYYYYLKPHHTCQL